MKNKRLIFVPVETKVRELHAKILLSCYAAQAGLSVVLGMQSELLRKVKYLPQGLYLEKGVSPPKEQGVKLLKGIGDKIGTWCKEGLVFVDQESYARDRVSAPVFSQLDVFYAWGKVQAGAIEGKMGKEAEKVVIAGNPRFDLLREPYRAIFSPEAERLKQEHGPFILVNTNFGLFNNFFGPDFFIEKIMRSHGRIENEKHEKFLQDWVDHVRKVYEAFLEILPELGRAFPDHKIVLRPHPSENHENWKNAAKGIRNVEVIHSGNVIPWVLASDVLVHNSCTTGVEAHVLGKPVVAFRPVRSDIYEYELPRVVSVPAFNAKELIDSLETAIKGELMEAPESSLGVDYAVNISGKFACETIVESLEEIFSTASFNGGLNMSYHVARTRWKAKDLWYDFKVQANRLLGRKQEDAAYMKQKIPGISGQEVDAIIRLFQETSGGFANVKAEKLKGSQYCFCINADPA